MIWTYDETIARPHEDDLASKICVFCHEPMHLLRESLGRQYGATRLRACSTCGWWTYWHQITSVTYDPDSLTPRWSLYGAAAQLREFDQLELSDGLQEVRRYLLAKFEARFEMHPRLFEETVASVFRDLGLETQLTAYSADGGVDVILRSPDGRTAGVQVKRVRRAIEVHEIRALAGVLLLGGHTCSVYVTTPRFRSGAVDAARRLCELSLPVRLVDASRLLDVLRINLRPAYADFFDWEEALGYPPDYSTVYENETAGG